MGEPTVQIMTRTGSINLRTGPSKSRTGPLNLLTEECFPADTNMAGDVDTKRNDVAVAGIKRNAIAVTGIQRNAVDVADDVLG